MDYTRRELLRLSRNLLLGTSLAPLFPGLLSKPLWADSLTASFAAPFFVMLRIDGGLDTTLGLDPKLKSQLAPEVNEQDVFLEYREEEILKVENLMLGPSAAPLKSHAADICIINGVQMRFDGGHPADNIYMATGRGDSTAASLPIELGLALGTGPFGVVIDGPIQQSERPINLSATTDLQRANQGANLLDFLQQKQKLNLLGNDSPWQAAQTQWLASQAVANNFDTLIKKIAQAEKKLESYHIAAAALASGGARQAQLQCPVAFNNLDTHANHEGVHIKAQTQVWQWVSDIFSAFKKIGYGQSNLFNATTFMAYSEFSRTPALNAAKGKDHNPFTNSVLLAGQKIRGGQVVGVSEIISRRRSRTGLPAYFAYPFDCATGKPASSQADAHGFIFPENVIRTIGEIYGQPATFTPVSPDLPPILGILKA